MAKYEAVNKKRRMGMVKKLFNWRMDSSMKIVTALEEVERLYREVHDLSEKKIQLDESAIITIFLGGLPKEYAVRVDAIESMGETNRDVILMRLQEKELDRRPLICWNCGEEGHRAENCRKPKQENKRDQSTNQNSNRGRGYGRSRGNNRGRDNNTDFRSKGKARAAHEPSKDDDRKNSADYENAYEGSSNESGYFVQEILPDERACRIELNERISNKYEFMLRDTENENGKALQARESTDPVIDGGATSHCSPEIELFESLDRRYTGRLGTAGKATRIAGKGVMRVPLSSSKILRLNNVLYVPGMTQTLLSTQIFICRRHEQCTLGRQRLSIL